MKKYTFFIAILSVVFLVQCGGGGEQGEVEYVTMDDGRQVSQGGTLIVGSISDVNSLNPYVLTTKTAQNIAGLMFLALLDIEPDLETYKPSLAKAWEFSEDRRTLTFHLRDDVYWWDGEKTTADDVVFSHSLAINPQVAWSAIRWKEFIESVEAVDDTTVVYNFSQVYPYQLMDATVGAIVPEHLLGDINPSDIATADFNTEPVGNGPFMFRNWRTQEQIELVKNPNYYEPNKPHLDRIVIRIVPDRTTLLTQLKTGQIDFLEDVPAKEFQQIRQNYELGETDIKPYEFLGRSYDYIAWNTIDAEAYDPGVHTTLESFDDIPNPFFADVNVRRAMSLAINGELIREAIGYGLLMEMNGPISPILWAHDESIQDLEYDPDEAKQLLQEAGWIDADGDGIREKDGVEFRFTMKTNTGNERREQACTLIQDMLKQIGVGMEIRLEEGVTFFNNMDSKQFEAALLGWSVGLKVDFTTIFHSESTLDKFNFTSYRNPEFDQLNDRAKTTMNRELARDMWREVQEVLVHDQPYTWLYYMNSGHGLHERFQNVIMDRRGAWLNLDEWWVPAAQRKYWMPNS